MNSKISTALLWDPNGGAIAGSTATSGAAENEDVRWYAIRTRSRFEKKVECLLRQRGTETFLPLLKTVHRWSDRDKAVQAPLFPGYVFVRLLCTHEQCLPIVKISGVLGFAGPGDQPSPIPDRDIEALQRLLETKTPCTILPFLHQGQRVRIRGGVLDGVVGTLDRSDGKHLVVSIACIQRSVSVRIEGYEVEVA